MNLAAIKICTKTPRAYPKQNDETALQ